MSFICYQFQSISVKLIKSVSSNNVLLGAIKIMKIQHYVLQLRRVRAHLSIWSKWNSNIQQHGHAINQAVVFQVIMPPQRGRCHGYRNNHKVYFPTNDWFIYLRPCIITRNRQLSKYSLVIDCCYLLIVNIRQLVHFLINTYFFIPSK